MTASRRPPPHCSKCFTPIAKFFRDQDEWHPCEDCDGALCEDCCEDAKLSKVETPPRSSPLAKTESAK